MQQLRLKRKAFIVEYVINMLNKQLFLLEYYFNQNLN